MMGDISFNASDAAFRILSFHKTLNHTPVSWEIGRAAYCQICKQAGFEPKLAEFSHGSYLGALFGIDMLAHEGAPLLVRLKVDRL